MDVVLAPELRALAERCGEERQRLSVASKRKDQHDLKQDDERGLLIHVMGAHGEAAVSAATGIPWSAHVNVFGVPDLPPDIYVRARSGIGSRQQLIVRREKGPRNPRGDSPGRYFLVLPSDPHAAAAAGYRVAEWTVVGWIRASQVWKHPEWMQDHGKRERAHFVPGSALVPWGGSCSRPAAPSLSASPGVRPFLWSCERKGCHNAEELLVKMADGSRWCIPCAQREARW